MEAIGHLLTTLIVQPIFNLLVFIYALLPGHNFGLAIIIFTLVVRMLMWPLVKKQLHHMKAMQSLQPELKKIKKAAVGNRQKESKLVMELYKEKGINPFSSIGILLAQLPIFIGLYLGIKRIAYDPIEMINFSYSWLHPLSWLQTLSVDIHRFDDSLFGVVNLTQKAIEGGKVYWPAILIAVASAAAQYFQSRQLLPKSDNARSLRSILGDAGKGKSADQQEVNVAAQRTMIIFIPALVFFAALQFPAALPLYWLVNSCVAYFQQSRILTQDVHEIETELDKIQPDTATTPIKKHSTKNKNRRSKTHRRKKR